MRNLPPGTILLELSMPGAYMRVHNYPSFCTMICVSTESSREELSTKGKELRLQSFFLNISRNANSQVLTFPGSK